MIAIRAAPARIGLGRAPRVALLAASLYAVVGTVTVRTARAAPQFARVGPSRFALAAEVAAGTALLLAAVAAQRRQPRLRYAVALGALAVAWLVGEWNSPGAGPAFTAGLVLYAAWPSLVAFVVLLGPDELPLSRAARAIVGVALLAALGLLGVASAAVFDPRDQGCPDCPANLLLVHGNAVAWRGLGQAGWLLICGSAIAAMLGGAAILARSSPARRRVAAPVVVPGLGLLALSGAQAVAALGQDYFVADRRLAVARTLGVGALAAGALWERARARRTRAKLADLVVELGEAPPSGGLQQRLAAVLGDSGLVLVHSDRDGQRWIDGNGRIVELPADREITPIVAGGRAISVLVHQPGLLADRALLREIAAVTRLALDHERWQALRRAELAELQASRARIVAAADRERRRLERDLHDGAQQALVTLAVNLRLARRQIGRDNPALEATLGAAEDDLRSVGAELRELAHGLFPAALADEGLAAALEALADQTPRLACRELDDGSLTAEAASAAYFVVAQAMRRDPDAEFTVRLRRSAERLVLDLRADRPLLRPATDFEDRIGAVGGSLLIDGCAIRVELPCGS
jgi:signal transduction histidine kinase